MRLLPLSFLKLFSIIVACSLSLNANAAVVTVSGDGTTFTGATGFSNNGVDYEVTFLDGVYDQLPGATEFPLSQTVLNNFVDELAVVFNNLIVDARGNNASNALPAVNGCSGFLFSACTILSPYGFDPADNSQYTAIGLIVENPVQAFNFGGTSLAADSDLSDVNVGGDRTYAVWTPAQVSAVPETDIYAMLMIGMALISLFNRREQV